MTILVASRVRLVASSVRLVASRVSLVAGSVRLVALLIDSMLPLFKRVVSMQHCWLLLERRALLKAGLLLPFLLGLLQVTQVQASERSIVLASTTSTENSGLLGYLLPEFQRDKAITVRVVAVGTGQAIRLARNGDADVLLVHHPASEQAFVDSGFGVERLAVMYNDFVIVGPGSDPAEIRGLAKVSEALARIRDTRSVFVSRGDDSGTHKRELDFWRALAADINDFDGKWYREAGMGQGATLNIAAEMEAYTLSDRGTWIKFGNKRNLALLVQGDPQLMNPYSVILVNPEQHPHVDVSAGQAFIDWLRSPKAQDMIARYRVNGQQLFFPDADNSLQVRKP